jgi:signal recognition particle receptor subunit beta
MGAGKTVLYYQLKFGTFMKTVTSAQLNSEKFVVAAPNSKSSSSSSSSDATALSFIDLPGHGSLRHHLPTLLPQSLAIIVVIDSLEVATDESHIENDAQTLYSVLVDAHIANGRVPILIACNKIDLVERSRGKEYIKGKLENAM